MTIVFISDIPWDGLHQRPQHLANRFARDATVLWIEPATLGHSWYWTPVLLDERLFRMTVPMFPLNARDRRVRRISSALSRIPFLRVCLDAVLARLVRRALARVSPAQERPVFFIQNFQLGRLADAIPAGRVLFDYIDDAFGFAPFPPHVTEAWHRMLRRADTLIVTSPMLGRRVREACGRDAVIIPNGVEYDRFQAGEKAPRPGDLPSGGPLIGYVGSVYPWLDYSLLEYAADSLPDAWFVIVGHEHPDVQESLNRLRNRPNVRILGVRPYATIPGYLAAFDAAIIPFLKTGLTEGVNPVKLYEYSAAGVTCVATDFSPDNRAFEKFLYIAGTREGFVAHLVAALQRRHDPEAVAALKSFARANDWNDRAAACVRLFSPSPHE